MYRIRFHGRGGQGMKTASQILSTAFFCEGFEVQDAPRYGTERRGAPMFAYVRASRETIHERGIIGHADLVVVADDTLVPVPAAGILQGMDAHTVLLINSHEVENTWRKRLNLDGPLLILPSGDTVGDRTELPYIDALCAGAAARDSGFLQIHCATCQEVLDSTLIAFRLAEHDRVRLPVIVNLDGFYLSFTREPVEIPNAAGARRFVGTFDAQTVRLRASAPESQAVAVLGGSPILTSATKLTWRRWRPTMSTNKSRPNSRTG